MRVADFVRERSAMDLMRRRLAASTSKRRNCSALREVVGGQQRGTGTVELPR
jgi:hypothetical protein